jgi:hypothetical protein
VDFRNLVLVARGDEQRRHATKLPGIFALASLTRFFFGGKIMA